METKRENPLKDKSYAFALKVVKTGKFLIKENHEYILSKQFIRSGTSVGSNIEEANQAESKEDFIHKLSISNKEAHETHFWTRLLRDSDELTEQQASGLLSDCEELLKMLTASIKTTKRRLPARRRSRYGRY